MVTILAYLKVERFSRRYTLLLFTFTVSFFLFFFSFLADLGLRCCSRAFFSCNEAGLPFVTVLRLLIEVASLVAEDRL